MELRGFPHRNRPALCYNCGYVSVTRNDADVTLGRAKVTDSNGKAAWLQPSVDTTVP